MDAVVETTEEGVTLTHIGITVCRGPGQHRLLLTTPYHQAGQIIEIPKSRIDKVTRLENGHTNGVSR
ncbi:MAG TPA: hypothetical protein VFZ80_04410 [Acidimicrobiia bacterium]